MVKKTNFPNLRFTQLLSWGFRSSGSRQDALSLNIRIRKFLGNVKFEMPEKSPFDNPVFWPSDPASYRKRTKFSTTKALTKRNALLHRWWNIVHRRHTELSTETCQRAVHDSSFHSPSYNRSIASSKTSSPQSAISWFFLPFPVSSSFLNCFQ